MTVAAIILSYKRTPNIPVIIKSLQGGKVKPDEIIVIDNNPKSNLQVQDVTLIRCSRNFGCLIRHAIAQVTGATHCLFIDDDLRVNPNTLHNFMRYHQRFPEAILGYFGMIVDYQATKAYYGGRRINRKGLLKPVAVDVVLGRIHFCRVDKLAQAFTVFNMIPDYPPPGSGVDDILLSMANRLHRHKNYVIPAGPQAGVRELPTFGTSLHGRKNHRSLRNHATQLLLELGNG